MANTCKARIGKKTGGMMCGAPCGNRHYCRVHRQQNAARQRQYRANARASASMVWLSWHVEDIAAHGTAPQFDAPQSHMAVEMASEWHAELTDSIGDDFGDGIPNAMGAEGGDG